MRVKLDHAERKDAVDIAALAQSLKLTDKSQKAGFLYYPHTAEDYAFIISLNNSVGDPFYVARDESNRLAGFIHGMEVRPRVPAYLSQHVESHEDLMYLYRNAPANFVFGEQIAVRPDLARRGLGSLLLNQMMRDAELSGVDDVYVSVLHSPVLNIASINFCEKFGFKLEREVRNNDGSAWGIYHASSHAELGEGK